MSASTEHERYLARRYLPELDGLRAISILLVFTTHIDALFWEELHGSVGVTVFFVLSGYLITTLALREEERDGRLDLGSFYVRRVFRIYPLYLIVLAAYCVLVLGLGMAADRRDAFLATLPYYLAFLPEQALAGGGPEPPFSGAWSLGIEEKFYFVWPLLGFVVLATRFRGRLAALGVILAGTAQASWFGPWGALIEPYALISMGCVAACLLHDERWFGRLRCLAHPGVLAAAALVLAAMLTQDSVVLGGDLYVAFGLPVVVLLVGVVLREGRTSRLLSTSPLVFLGRISYAFYLTHNFALNGVQGLLPDSPAARGLLAPAIALAVAVLIAWGLHVTIERPLIAVGHRLAHRNKRAPRLPDASGGTSRSAPRTGLLDGGTT